MSNEFYINSDQSGRRIDRLLRNMWPQVPLGALMKAIRTGEVRLDAKRVSPNIRVEEGQFVQVPWNDDMSGKSTIKVKSMADKHERLETIYKDNYLWIINKPAGLLTQPNIKNGDSLISRALAELKWTRNDFRPSTVQRLDRNTSGAVIVALTGPSLRYLSELIRERKIKKIYRAIVSGDISESGEINLPLLKYPAKNIVKVDERGQSSLTKYRKISSAKNISIVEADLVTGRPHQARVHFAAVSHPIIGDRKYGGDMRQAKRPMLHAYSVTFPEDKELPETIRGREFKAPLPRDMEEYIKGT